MKIDHILKEKLDVIQQTIELQTELLAIVAKALAPEQFEKTEGKK